MKRILWIGGDQPRHLYYVNELTKVFPIVGGIMQLRENPIPDAPKGLWPIDKSLWKRHFEERKKAEDKYFGEQELPNIPIYTVDKNTLNDEDTVWFVKELKPDMAIVFGTGMIREPLLSVLPQKTINLHLGLSPRYRGAATLFWPFYFMEPNWAGTTFHFLKHSPDAGDIIHQVVPKLEWGDGIHDVACKAVLQSTWEALALFKMGNWEVFKQKPEAGKNFLESDFQPTHLRVIYHVFCNNLVDVYLQGRIKPKEPKLKRQF